MTAIMDRKTRRQRILEHIGRYRLSMRPVLSKLFFEGKSCDNVLRALVEGGFVQVRSRASRLPGGWSYYQLTPAAAAELGVPANRALPLSPASLEKNLAILWFCCMTEPRRSRLDRRHLEALIGADRAGDYCVEPAATQRIYRLFPVSPKARSDYFLKAIRTDLEAALGEKALADYLAVRLYGYAVLVSSQTWKLRAEAALRKASLAKTAPWIVEVVPGAATLPTFLAEERTP